MIKRLENKDGSFFSLASGSEIPKVDGKGNFRIIWTNGSGTQLKVDQEEISLQANEVLTLTPYQHIDWIAVENAYLFSYNKDFYCVLDHDHEIGCAGLIYFGEVKTPIIKLDEGSQRKFDLLLQVFWDELETRDNIQDEMLRMLLKRLIILTTRLFKQQNPKGGVTDEQETIRRFHVLLEKHFRQKQKVSDYADLLFKSPKTLSNLFSKNHQPPPLKQIQERIALEAKRLLIYTDKTIKEIAWELNFEEVSHFSRFFRRMVEQSPSDFRKSKQNQGLSGKSGRV